MEFRNFHFRVILRVLLLAITLSLLIYCLLEELYLRGTYAGILVCIQIIELFFFITRFTRNITAFLQSVRERDFSVRFNDHREGKPFNELYSSLNSLTELFRKISIEKEVKHRYLETLVSHISFGVICFNEEEKVMLVNEAFLKLAGTLHLHTLSQLRAKNLLLFREIQSIPPGKKKLIKIPTNNQLLTLSLYASEFKLDQAQFKLISAQNITSELSSTEMEAWQRLIKVLTHEIMNSVSPIISLSGSLYDITKTSNAEGGTLQQGLEAIKVRSEGLLSFTQRYRKLTQIPAPEFKSVNVDGFFEHITRLIQPEIDKQNINLQINIQPVTATWDSVLIEQAIINLIQNAVDAVEKQQQPFIGLELSVQGERITIKIRDNGSGIPAGDLDKIFVPFFTTKSNGSGIGLALARQIILLHGGQISVQSEIGTGTTFTITL